MFYAVYPALLQISRVALKRLIEGAKVSCHCWELGGVTWDGASLSKLERILWVLPAFS